MVDKMVTAVRAMLLSANNARERIGDEGAFL